jgi:diguanylate cyclase (GGDEF)-like protein
MRFDWAARQADHEFALFSWIRRSVARRVAVVATLVAAASSAVVGLIVVGVVLRDAAGWVRRDILLVAVLGGAGTVAAVAVATVVIVNRLLAATLRSLTDSLHLAERGQWMVTARSDRTDEIGDLSRAFDRLCKAVTDLSVDVIDKGRELAWTQRELKLADALKLLFELTQTLSTEADSQALLAAIADKVAPAMGLDTMAILLADERGNLVVRSTAGLPADVLGVIFGRDDKLSGVVAATGEPIVIPDTARDPRYSHFQGHHLKDGAFACVPMKLHGRVTGVFNVLRTDAFSDADLGLLASLASYTALALAHDQQSQRLRALATTDDLTGVANRRLLSERAAADLERMRRAKKPMAVLMVDLDHFKRVNDEFGHKRGDQVLHAIAQTLLHHVRRIDTVARYGGEEFVVLLPDTAREHALVVADKLRTVAEEHVHDGLTVTLSIGVAMFPEDGAGEEALIEAADRALLRAKREGRNRVVAA